MHKKVLVSIIVLAVIVAAGVFYLAQQSPQASQSLYGPLVRVQVALQYPEGTAPKTADTARLYYVTSSGKVNLMNANTFPTSSRSFDVLNEDGYTNRVMGMTFFAAPDEIQKGMRVRAVHVQSGCYSEAVITKTAKFPYNVLITDPRIEDLRYVTASKPLIQGKNQVTYITPIYTNCNSH